MSNVGRILRASRPFGRSNLQSKSDVLRGVKDEKQINFIDCVVKAIQMNYDKKLAC